MIGSFPSASARILGEPGNSVLFFRALRGILSDVSQGLFQFVLSCADGHTWGTLSYVAHLSYILHKTYTSNTMFVFYYGRPHGFGTDAVSGICFHFLFISFLARERTNLEPVPGREPPNQIHLP